MIHRPLALAALASLAAPAAAATEPTIAELQRQIDELKAMVEQLKAAQKAGAPATAATPAQAPVTAAALATAPTPLAAPAQATAAAPAAPIITAEPAARAPAQPAAVQQASAAPAAKGKAWYDGLQIRGYTQLRVNEIISGDATAPAGQSRLRSVQDAGISDQNNFSFRRVRLIVQGDITDDVSIYLQPDFASAVSNQSVGERREGFGQLRDAYVDWHFGPAKEWTLRFGQSKVPFGWENLQSSSNRVPLDRTDAINSAVPGERDLGVIAYYTPAQVDRVWKRLAADGQKLFGNYGAFALAAMNGQGTNRTETNNDLMLVAMATMPFELDGLGSAFSGQVLELGGSAMLNQFQPELRSGGISPTSFDDNRVVVHAMLYPQPFGIQTEWTWGTGPEFDSVTNSIQEKPLSGGYVMAMYRVRKSPLGPFIPFGRWQTFRGGWKAALNSPRLETDEFEMGVEFQPTEPLELTLSYSHMKRREADERRTGVAEGDVLRAQLQWNY
jgi:phosphate-selective porin